MEIWKLSRILKFGKFCPDSLSLGFFADGKLKRVEAAGGLPQTIADSASSRGGAWNRDGVILFAPSTGVGLFRVSAARGECLRR